MPAPRLDVTLKKAQKELDRLEQIRSSVNCLEVKYQYFISEMIMLRLFWLFESTVAELAGKLACGAVYMNGNAPNVQCRANSISGAMRLFREYGRKKPMKYLKWSKSQYIKRSVKYVLCPEDSFLVYAEIHGELINEMRKVRNVLAHSSASARADYKDVVRCLYGARINIAPGAFLISTKRSKICNLERYLRSLRLILNDMAAGGNPLS